MSSHSSTKWLCWKETPTQCRNWSTLLAFSSVTFSYWDEAFLTAAYLINCLPSPITQHKSPIDILYHKIPDYKFLKTFKYACWPHLCPYNSHKLDFWSKRCIFLSYSLNHKGYHCLDPTTNRIYIAHNVIFDKSVFPFASLSISSDIPHGSNTSISIPPVQSLSQTNPSTTFHNPRVPPPIFSHQPENISPISVSPSIPTNVTLQASDRATPTSQHPMITRSRANINKPNRCSQDWLNIHYRRLLWQ